MDDSLNTAPDNPKNSGTKNGPVFLDANGEMVSGAEEIASSPATAAGGLAADLSLDSGVEDLLKKAREDARRTNEEAVKIILQKDMPEVRVDEPSAPAEQIFSQDQIEPKAQVVPARKPEVSVTQEAPAMPATPENKEAWEALKNLRTYQGDVAGIIKDQGESVLSVSMAERRRREERGEKQEEEKEESPWKNTWLAVGAALLFVLGVGLLGGFYYINRQNAPLTQIPPSDALVRFDMEREIFFGGLTKSALVDLLASLKSDGPAESKSLSYVRIVRREENAAVPITASEFMSLIRSGAPSSFVRALGDKFMLGFYKDNLSERHEAFLLLSVNSFDTAFDGLLRWEGTMAGDLSGIITPFALPADVEALFSLGATQETRRFQDMVIDNKDVRLLKGEANQTVLLYAFIRPDLLLIAESERVLSEIMLRVFSAATVR